MIKILIVEDQAMVLGALTALINLESDMEVVASATNGEQALIGCDNHEVDIVLSDIEMPVMNGLELARALQVSEHTCKVVMLTTFSRSGYIKQALDVDVVGYLLKDTPSDKLAAAIRDVMAGRIVIAENLLKIAREVGDNLMTEKEQRILKLALEGKSNEEIAQRLFLSNGTIRNYIHEICQKLNAKNKIEAARYALDLGWL